LEEAADITAIADGDTEGARVSGSARVLVIVLIIYMLGGFARI
jgi:hypothetical protein